MTPEQQQELAIFILSADTVADGALSYVQTYPAMAGDPEIERLILQDVGASLAYMVLFSKTPWPELLAVINQSNNQFLRDIYFSCEYRDIDEQFPRPKRRRVRKSEKK